MRCADLTPDAGQDAQGLHQRQQPRFAHERRRRAGAAARERAGGRLSERRAGLPGAPAVAGRPRGQRPSQGADQNGIFMPGGSGMPAVTLPIFGLAHFLGVAQRVVERGGDHVLEHVLVVGEQARVDGDAAHVVLAGHRDLDEAVAGLAVDLDVGELVLHLLQVVLHRLGLLHQTGELTFHHGVRPFVFGGRPGNQSGLTEPGRMRAVWNCASKARTVASDWISSMAARWRRSASAASRLSGRVLRVAHLDHELQALAGELAQDAGQLLGQRGVAQRLEATRRRQVGTSPRLAGDEFGLHRQRAHHRDQLAGLGALLDQRVPARAERGALERRQRGRRRPPVARRRAARRRARRRGSGSRSSRSRTRALRGRRRRCRARPRVGGGRSSIRSSGSSSPQGGSPSSARPWRWPPRARAPCAAAARRRARARGRPRRGSEARRGPRAGGGAGARSALHGDGAGDGSGVGAEATRAPPARARGTGARARHAAARARRPPARAAAVRLARARPPGRSRPRRDRRRRPRKRHEAQQHHHQPGVFVGRQAQLGAAVHGDAVEQLRLVGRPSRRPACGRPRCRSRLASSAPGSACSTAICCSRRRHLLQRARGRQAQAAQRVDLAQHRAGVAPRERLDERLAWLRSTVPSIARTAALLERAGAVGDGLVGERQRVAHRAARAARQQAQRAGVERDALGAQHLLQVGGHRLGRHRPQVELQAAAEHRGQHLLGVGRGQHELEVLGRLLQRLQQRVEGVLRELVRLVDHEDLVAAHARLVGGALDRSRISSMERLDAASSSM